MFLFFSEKIPFTGIDSRPDASEGYEVVMEKVLESLLVID